MVRSLKEFIASNVEKKIIKRDLLISGDINATYLEPLEKAWKEYGIGKQEIIFLAIVLAYKYEKQISNMDKLDCEKSVKGTKIADMGRLVDFNETKLTFLVSILISKYGIDKVVDNVGDVWEDLRVMAEQGIKVLYCKIYKEKELPTEIFNTLLDLDGIKFS